MLRVEGISVHYGHMPALVDVSLEMADGEFVGVIGSNRAGKTTFAQSYIRFGAAQLRRHISG